MLSFDDFDDLFKKATENTPFPYQRKFATEGEIPELVNVPTGLGKTSMAVLGWLWRRRFASEEIRQRTPRRSVYCLPMRTLVEQTRDNTVLWLYNLELLAGSAQWDEQDGHKLRSYTPDLNDSDNIAVHVLMGGEDEEDWDIYPERDQIVIGTQDMLLSRALNRGYAESRSRWPLQFGLLNNDCFWVFDEIQLMGSGLATTAQLEAFRRLLPDKSRGAASNSHGCRSVWMSATMRSDWLKTVDFEQFLNSAKPLTFDFDTEIAASGLDEAARQQLRQRWEAKKPLERAKTAMGNASELADEVLAKHLHGTRTIVVLNTVKRACELYTALKEHSGKAADSNPRIVLLHSRFRSGDRKNHVEKALSNVDPHGPGMIVVSTQVIEAGVDVSATTLFTELAPWASLVQRFGRCNRRGEDNQKAKVYWVAMPGEKKEAEGNAKPYKLDDIKKAEERLKDLPDAGLKSLPEVKLDFEHTHVIRQKDLVDLFDTTSDLAGNDIDIDRFVREVDDSDVHVFWRDWERLKGHEPPPDDEPRPRREELCPAPIREFQDFAKKHSSEIWRWDFLEGKWGKAEGRVAPGQVFVLHSKAGGYTEEQGWNPHSDDRVEPVPPPVGISVEEQDSTDDDQPSRVWQTIAQHTTDDCIMLDGILRATNVPAENAEALRQAMRWHDRGKAHRVFQTAIDDGQVLERNGQTVQRRERPEDWRGCRLMAKAPDRRKNARGEIIDLGFWRPYDWVPGEGRRHFRHELASALSVLDPWNDKIPDERRNLIAYLVAAHHGKVRISIRSLPNESHPDGSRRFARGIWDKDKLPETDLGGGVIAPAATLSLEPMELGLCEREPFKGQASWAERMLRLRDTLGPFNLAYLEAILRAADMRASQEDHL